MCWRTVLIMGNDRIQARKAVLSIKEDIMQKLKVMLFLLLICSLASAQSIEEYNYYQRLMAERKTQCFKKLRQAEMQMTRNQEEYDAKYYALDLTPNPETERLSGSVQIIGEVIAPTLDHVELNFWDGMYISDIHTTNSPANQLPYDRAYDILSIDLERTYEQGEQFDVTVVYSGRPQRSYYYSFGFDEYKGEPLIWTLSQPIGARAWWPCKDVPSDKADSVDIRVTVPSELIVASNGTLRSEQTEGDQTTYWWHEQYPITTYLVSLAIYPYEVHYDDYVYNNGANSMKIHFYTFPGNFQIYADLNAQVKDMLAFFSDKFGEYPFIEEKYGHADFRGGGMEHQTCTSLGFWNEFVYAHELAHQWWGDMITCDSWHHTWLNEGFATYSEALWWEHVRGPGTANEYQMNRNSYFGRGNVYVDNPENFLNADVYSDYSLILAYFDDNPLEPNLVYKKASWILHMLRHVVSDDVFFDILKTYYSSPLHQHGTATSEGFQAVCEQVSGIDLDKFFHQWLYEEYCPRYSYAWNYNSNGALYDVQLTITQEQTNHIFWMPIDVTITTTGGDTTFVVWDSLQTQTFELSVASEPLEVELDKDNWILKTVQGPIQNPTFDQGILIVNGVWFDQWNYNYGFEIQDAYEQRTFWADFPISFWDCFAPPSGGYPSTLPNPIGHGKIPDDVLGQFSSIVWIGGESSTNDLSYWQQASIVPYLNAGGNVFLLAGDASSYITNEKEQYIGISSVDTLHNGVLNCKSVYPGMVDMEFLAGQAYISVFDANLSNQECTLLFEGTDIYNETWGLGAWYKPEAGGINRSDGGQFVLISGKPYRYYWDQLRSNVAFILENFFLESKPTDVSDNSHKLPMTFKLDQNYPNPFNAETVIRFHMPQQEKVSLIIFNLMGQEVRRLVDEERRVGIHRVVWDGKDNRGFDVSSGVYVCIFKGEKLLKRNKITLLR